MCNGRIGDGTVPYASLSWCHRWLGEKDDVTVTKIPQRFYHREDPNEEILVPGGHSPEPMQGAALTVTSLRPGEPLITFYEATNTTHATAVWEIDGIDHRDVIRNRVFLREFAEEMLHEHSRMFFSPSLQSLAIPGLLILRISASVRMQCGPECSEGVGMAFSSFSHKVSSHK